MRENTIPVRRHRVGDRVWSVDNPTLHGTITAVERGSIPRMTVAWDDGTTTEPVYLRIVNEAW